MFIKQIKKLLQSIKLSYLSPAVISHILFYLYKYFNKLFLTIYANLLPLNWFNYAVFKLQIELYSVFLGNLYKNYVRTYATHILAVTPSNS